MLEPEDITPTSLQSLIDNKVEESLNLEYKSSGAFDNNQTKKREIAITVSSFSNANGGLVIYGIEERNHLPKAFSYINGSVYTKEWLEQSIMSNCSRNIEGLEIIPIRFDDDIKKTVYAVKVPSNESFPIMVNTRFYRRHNFMSVPMEEYEVRSLYFKNNTSKLEISDINASITPRVSLGGYVSIFRLSIEVRIKNISSIIENHYKTELAVPKNLYTNSRIRQDIDSFRKEYTTEYTVLVFPNTSPLFPSEDYQVSLNHLEVKAETINEVLIKPVLLKVYYSGGAISKSIDLKEFLIFEGKVVDSTYFR